MTCEICDTAIEEIGMKALDDLVCPTCGQRYQYEEGYQIILTQEQCELLRQAKQGVS